MIHIVFEVGLVMPYVSQNVLLQTKIALSTMEAEYVALSSSCPDLFPLIDITQEICSALLLHPPDTAQMHIKIHEHNVGTLVLGLNHGV
jgi:hypothetical protein